MTVLIVLGSVLLSLILLLCFPLSLRITASNTKIHAEISYLRIFRKRLYPLPSKPKKSKKQTKSKAEAKGGSAPAKKEKASPFRRIRELRSLIAAILLRMPDTFSLRIKRLTVAVRSDDPAKTALLYGAVSSGLAYTTEWLDRHLLTIRRPRIGAVSVYADFEGEESSLECDLRLHASIFRLLAILIKVILPHFIKWRVKRKKIQKATKGTIPCPK